MTHQQLAITLIAVLAGPIAWAAGDGGPVPGSGAVTSIGSSAEAEAKTAPKAAADVPPDASAPRIIRGNDRVIAPPKPVAQADGPATSFKFEEAPIAEVVRTMLGDLLKVDYVLYPPLNGTITLATRNAVSADQAIFLLESALQANGLAMVRDARGTYHVGKVEALKGISSGIRQVTPNKAMLQPGSGAIIVPLQYIGAAEMATILRPMAPSDAIVRVDSVRNILVLAGNRAQAEGWLDIVNTFDVDLLKGMSVGLFPLKHASIKEVEAALRLVSGGGGSSSGGTQAAAATASGAPAATGTSARAGAAVGASAAAVLGESNPLFGALRIMPVERLNAVLVVTPRAAYLEEARQWIEKLDQPSDGGGEPTLHIYRVQNGNARHLASVLSGIFGGMGGVADGASTGVAPGLGTSVGSTIGANYGGNAGNSNFGGFGGNNFNRSGTNFGGSGGLGGFGGGTAANFGSQSRFNGQQGNTGQMVATNIGGIRVMPDEHNNSILVWSTRPEFQKIEATLKRLDLPPTQVLIEASIIEVTLNDDLKYGLQWAFSDTHRGGRGNGLVGRVPAASSGGFSYTLKDPMGNIRVTLNALADKSLIKVISSPSLMVLDNQTASIAVGTQQPVRTGEITTNNGTTTPVTSTSFQYKDTGVQLAVQPSVNSGDLVTMDITQSVTDVGDEDTVTGQRAFLQRQISSKVAVRSGEAIVLGGLIKDNASSGRAGVPVLSSLPVVGGLFGATTSNSGRTELLVVITPKVVRTDPEIREVSEELRDRLRGLEALNLRDRSDAKRSDVAQPQQPVVPLPSQ